MTLGADLRWRQIVNITKNDLCNATIFLWWWKLQTDYVAEVSSYLYTQKKNYMQQAVDADSDWNEPV